ncbi:PREDICTED: transcription factor TGA2.2-like isoform X2 [Ipomoea nil]|nr:PREDICTED: transcription factor TGA2.2-like isoform X2 [Ipomoea nil]
MPYALFHGGPNPATTSFMFHSTPNGQEGSSAFDFGELEEAIVLQGVKINKNDEVKDSLYADRPAPTLEMFPSWPTRFHPTPPRGGSSTRSGGEDSGDSGFANRAEGPESSISTKASDQHSFDQRQPQFLQTEMATSDSPVPAGNASQADQPPPKHPTQDKRKGAASSSDRNLDAKTLRRLAQNREAARKSRLRKKAYVQQLETSRIRLAQLEQELQRARSQGILVGGGAGASAGISSAGAAIFDMEYARWLEDDDRHMSELRTALQAHLSDDDLRVIIDGYIAHYDKIFRLKGVAARTDVFHLITGMWMTQAERCFLWMGGFRPSDLIKMLCGQLDPLTEQQVMGIYSLQHSTQQAEEALTQGLDQLQHSLVETIATASLNHGMHHMAIALGKLSNLEGFIRQADNLRQQTLHQLCRILTVRQAVRCFLVIGEYYGRLRALSSLWISRPRETTLVVDNNGACQATMELQMVQNSHQNQFANF